MGIEVNTGNGVYHAKIQGELTIYTAGEYQDVLLESCHIQQAMELDLSEVTAVDASGLQLLVALNNHFCGTNNGLRLGNSSEAVREAMELTRLTETFADDNGGAA